MRNILVIGFLIIVSSSSSLAYKAEDPLLPPKPETKIDQPVDKEQMIKTERERLAADRRLWEEKKEAANKQFDQFDATCAKSRKKTPECDSLQQRLWDLKKALLQERDGLNQRAEKIKKMEEELGKLRGQLRDRSTEQERSIEQLPKK